MDGLARTWMALSNTKRIVLLSVVAATLALTFMLAQIAQRPSFVLLFGGLDQKAAGDVVVQLDQMGVVNEVRGAGIYVPESERDRVRMALAAIGMPATGQQGYELLDTLTGFGTTAEMFDAAYWRAKEGELARTLLAGNGVRQARVHIGTPRRRTFARDRVIPTASITLTGSAGRVSESTALAARYLVANAIPGLEPDQVAVIDANSGVILKPGQETAGPAQATEADRAKKMKMEIEDILSARVGDGRARVSVNIERNLETETISRRTIDPETRALRQSDSVEMTSSGEESGGAVTVASNLPDGDAAGGSGSSQREEARKTDKYDYTETREEILRPAGTIRQVSVAILLDDIRETDADGNVTTTARPAAELASLEALVKSAIGFNEERGDQVTIKSISFAALPDEGTVAVEEELPSFVEQNMMQLIQLGALVFIIALLGLFVVRPILSGRNNPAMLENDDPALSAIDVTPPSGDAARASAAGETASQSTEIAPLDPVDILRNAIESQNDESVSVLKGWLEADPKTEAA